MRLQTLNDNALLSHVQQIAASERKIYSQIIEALEEIERRKLYLARGYSSLYTFCTDYLKYSQGAAHRRLSSMRLVKNMPSSHKDKIKEKIETGSVNLTHLSQVATAIRTMPRLTNHQKMKLVERVENTSRDECEKRLIEAGGKESFKREDFKRLNKKEIRISVSFDEESFELLTEYIELTAHKNPWASKEKALCMALRQAVDQERRDKTAKTAKWPKSPNMGAADMPPTTSVPTTFKAPTETVSAAELTRQRNADRKRTRASASQAEIAKDHDSVANETNSILYAKQRQPEASDVLVKRNRFIPLSVRREVWTRDKGRCQYVDSGTGRTCNSRFALQLDHIHEFSNGGSHDLANLRLLCANHNRYRGKLRHNDLV